MLKQLKRISRNIKLQNPFWDYVIDEYEYPNGKIGKYFYVETCGSTFVIPVLSNGNILLTKQYRYLNQKESIEFPGGGIKKGYSKEKNAFEELSEETGFGSDNIKLIGEFNPYNGVTNEICSVFIATDLYKKDKECDETEEFILLELSEKEILQKISSGEIWDGMTLAAWSLYYFTKNS